MRVPAGRWRLAVTIAAASLLAGSLQPRAALGAGAATTAPRTVTPLTFGAVGDGVADDTAALQRALDALHPGDALRIDAGRVYRHTDVLHVRVPGVRLTGPGALLATDQSRSSVFLEADDLLVDGGLVVRTTGTTRRWDAYEQMGLRLTAHQGITVSDVTVEGSAAAGVYVGGASHFLLRRVHVEGTRADGIHMTGGSHDGVVTGAVVSRTGDDGIAVVSYSADAQPVRRITIRRSRVSDNTWGRGISVVGGEDVAISDARIARTDAAGVYIASEGAPYFTDAPRRVRVVRTTITDANTDAEVGHGALLVYAGSADHPPADVLVAGLVIKEVPTTTPWQVGLIADPGASMGRVRLVDVTTAPGPVDAFAASRVPAADYRRIGWSSGP